MNKQLLEDAINGLEQLKPVLQRMLIRTKYEGLGREDAQELGEHFDIALECMQKQLTGGWIPVSERLPEDGSDVLLTLKRKSDGIVYIGVCYRWENENWDFAEPLAWQPLPEPYKEDKDAERN